MKKKPVEKFERCKTCRYCRSADDPLAPKENLYKSYWPWCSNSKSRAFRKRVDPAHGCKYHSKKAPWWMRLFNKVMSYVK